MGIRLTITAVNIDTAKLVSKLDDTFWLSVAQEYKKLMKPFIPYKSHDLANNARVHPKEVEYWQAYARYIYEGKAMGPTYPIMRGGTVVGFYSAPKKHLTGASLHFNHGSEKWDEKNRATLEPKLVTFAQGYVDTKINWND